MKIISISGLDGSGKSTQLELLKKDFESQGKKVFYFHAVNFSIANLLNKNKKAGANNGVTQASWIKILLRFLAMRIDIFRFKKLKKDLSSQGYDFILSDRFFYDSVVNLAYLMTQKMPPGIEKSIPRSDIAFYLKTDPKSIMKRKRAPEQGFSYLESKNALYDTCAPIWDMITVDGNDSAENIHEKIASYAIQGFNK
ncbi:MAG: hypothetical protein ACD_8C00047G0008 [uncultured bacterium]|nr:MAG: hypothetical protein ACD_8C00047G0008 [uncultured bacterium]